MGSIDANELFVGCCAPHESTRHKACDHVQDLVADLRAQVAALTAERDKALQEIVRMRFWLEDVREYVLRKQTPESLHWLGSTPEFVEVMLTILSRKAEGALIGNLSDRHITRLMKGDLGAVNEITTDCVLPVAQRMMSRLQEAEAVNASLREASLRVWGVYGGSDHHPDNCPAPGDCAACNFEQALAAAPSEVLTEIRAVIASIVEGEAALDMQACRCSAGGVLDDFGDALGFRCTRCKGLRELRTAIDHLRRRFGEGAA